MPNARIFLRHFKDRRARRRSWFILQKGAREPPFSHAMRRLFLPEMPCVKHTQLEVHRRLMRFAHRLRRKSLMIFELSRQSGMAKDNGFAIPFFIP